jgi:hypothetical protein
MESAFRSLTFFFAIILELPFQFLCSQAHILVGWRPETRLLTTRLCCRAACLLIRCLAVDILLLHSLAYEEMCLPSRCQAVAIRVTIGLNFVFVRCRK